MNNALKTSTLDNVGPVKMCKRVLKNQTSPNEKIPFFKISTFGSKPDVFISTELFTDYSNRYSYPKKGDILISAAGTVGKTVVFDGKPSYFQDSNIVWIDNDERLILNKYLYYFYQTKPWQTTNGSTITRIYNDDLRSIKVNYPESLDDQENISNILLNIDNKIELNNKINSELESMAKLLYDYWFVQFDFPDENGKPYKSSGGKMVWSDDLKRHIPKGWDVSMLKNIAKVINGQSPKGSSYNYEQRGIPLINGPADYESGSLMARTYTTEPTRLCKEDDFVLCIRATIGNLTFAEGDYCLGRGVAAIRINDRKMLELSHFFLLQEIERFKIQAGGSIIVGITKDDLTDALFLVPDPMLIDQFHSMMKPIFTKIRLNKQQNLKLVELRDWLLPMLMNGQVRVED